MPGLGLGSKDGPPGVGGEEEGGTAEGHYGPRGGEREGGHMRPPSGKSIILLVQLVGSLNLMRPTSRKCNI